MTIHEPYNFSQLLYDYEFRTDNGILYSVRFSNGAFMFVGLPPYIPVYEVSIDIIELGNKPSPPKDIRVESTIINIFRHFLMEHENSIVYVCDNLDNKHAARNRKFNTWFQRSKTNEIEKYDTYFTVESIEIYASLIIHAQNSFKSEVINIFLNQQNEYDKD